MQATRPAITPMLVPGQFQFMFVGSNPIGEGGLGRVDRIRVAASNAHGKPVGSEWAIKRLNSKWAAHPAMRERFEREIAAVKEMKHPNIVTFEGENIPGYERFYVMPLFTNTLRRCVAGGALRANWRQVALHGAALAEAMQYAHDRRFIHRDFKPDNVLFDAQGPLVIADWGLGYFVHRESVVLQQLTVGGMGTAYYCSAEQWQTGKCDCRGDIYSLGMTLDEWVTGQQRVIKVGFGIGSAEPSGGLTWGARRFDALLRRMTEFGKSARPASMREVAAELRTIAGLV